MSANIYGEIAKYIICCYDNVLDNYHNETVIISGIAKILIYVLLLFLYYKNEKSTMYYITSSFLYIVITIEILHIQYYLKNTNKTKTNTGNDTKDTKDTKDNVNLDKNDKPERQSSKNNKIEESCKVNELDKCAKIKTDKNEVLNGKKKNKIRKMPK